MSLLTAPLAAAALLLSAAGYGGLLLAPVRRCSARGIPLAGLHGAALGMGLIALLVLAAGLAGQLHPVALILIAGGGWILLILLRRDLLFGPARRLAGLVRKPESSAEWMASGLVAAGFLFALASAVSAFRPPDGLDWDSLSYHLAAPRIYLREGRIGLIAYDSHTNFPFTMQMLYMVGLAWEGPAAARLIHWACGWLTAIAAGWWAARLSPVPWVGPLAALIFASAPLALWEMGVTYVDLGTALFQLLALLAILDAVDEEQGRLKVAPALVALAGMQTGFALGTKYTALLQWGLLGLGLLWLIWRSARVHRPAAVRAVALYGLLSLVIASPWYVKNWVWVGNPVYPFYYSLFPGSFSWDREMEEGYAGEQKLFGMKGSAVEQIRRGEGAAVAAQAIRLPWDLAMHGRAFYITDRSMAGDKLGSAGPFWVGLLPLLFWTPVLRGRLGAIGLYCLASVAAWFFMTQQSRYLLPVFAPLAIPLAAGVAALDGLVIRRAAGAFIGAGLLLNLQMHLPLAEVALPVALGSQDRAAYLRQSLPGLYEASEWVNANLPKESRIALYQETRGYYLDRPYFWANPGQHRMIVYDDLGSPSELMAELRRFGITHVLINWDFVEGVREHHWFRLVTGAINAGQLRPVFRSSNWQPDRRGVVVYRLAEGEPE